MPTKDPKSTVSGGPYAQQDHMLTPGGGVDKGPARKGKQPLTGKGKGPNVGYHAINASRGNGAPVKGGANDLSKGPKQGRISKSGKPNNNFQKFGNMVRDRSKSGSSS